MQVKSESWIISVPALKIILQHFKANAAFELIEGDIRDFETCKKAVDGY